MVGPVRIFDWDPYYDVDTNKADDILQTMAYQDIHFHCLEISGSTAKMFEAFQRVYNNKDEGRVMKVHTMTSNPSSVLSTILKASFSSVQESLTKASSSTCLPKDIATMKHVPLDPNIDWESMAGWKKLQATMESMFVQDEACTEFQVHKMGTVVHLAPKPFSHGAMRAAYALYDEGSAQGSGTRLVAKKYLNDRKYNSPEVLMGDIRSQALASRLVERFNKLRPQSAPLCFVQVQLMRVTIDGREELMTVEPFIAGEYRKETNNASFAREGSEVAQAFSHFTHDVTGGAFMVVDLQGVREALTDPQVHSKQPGSFGRGNLGQRGFDAFFMVHKCNDHCRELKLKPNPLQVSGFDPSLLQGFSLCPLNLE